MKIDTTKLDAMTIAELTQLRADVDAAMPRVKAKGLASVRAECAKIAEAAGVTLREVARGTYVQTARSTAARSRKARPVTTNPVTTNPATGQTWNGRGRKPRWMHIAKTNGTPTPAA